MELQIVFNYNFIRLNIIKELSNCFCIYMINVSCNDVQMFESSVVHLCVTSMFAPHINSNGTVLLHSSKAKSEEEADSWQRKVAEADDACHPLSGAESQPFFFLHFRGN